MPIYLCRWSQGYVKLGWAEDVPQRLSDSFKDNSHPPDLCNKLTREHFILVGIWEGSKEEEEEMPHFLHCPNGVKWILKLQK